MSGAPRVLVVDDRRENRIALRGLLAPLDVEVVEAPSGDAALRALLHGDVAVILLDVQMPGLDGFETAALIKNRPRSADVPIIFLTAAQADVAEVFAGYEAGAVDFLLKPFDPIVLRSKVAVFASLARQRAALARSDELLRGAFDATPSGLAVCDLDGRVVRANAALVELVGPLTPGLRVADLLDERSGRRLQLSVESMLGNGGDPERMSIGGEARDHHDRPFPVTLTVAVVRDMAGEPAQVLVAMADERDRQIARTLQRSLLPDRLPAAPGLSIAAQVLAGGGGTQVGGDWYDAITLPGGRLGVVVGDVAGRGIEAAARMGELRSVARAYALEGHSPAEVVERLNGYHAALGLDLLTTLVYAVFEIDTGLVRIVNAGHPPPLVRREGEEPVPVKGTGPPLGVIETWRYHEDTIEVPTGTVVVLYTDGLVERRDESLTEGLERLRFAVGASDGDVETLCSQLVSTLDAGRAADDVTCVAVRTEPVLGPVARMKLSADMASLSTMRRVLTRWLREAGAGEAEIPRLVMAANESWQNALEHGTAFAPAMVDIELEADGDQVSICVRDTGTRSTAPDPDPDRGRGIELMRALVDDVEIGLSAEGSIARLRHRLRGEDGRPTAPARERVH